jgi:hypothetical protein
LLKAVAPWPAICLGAQLAFWFGRFATRQYFVAVPMALRVLLLVPITAGVFLFNDGVFGNAQLVAGTVSIFVFAGFTVVLYFFRYLIITLKATAALGPALFDKHAWAGMVRWLELRDETAGDASSLENGANEKTTSRLLEHDDGDTKCPCVLPSCVGGLPARSGWTALSWSVTSSIFQVMGFFGSLWSPAITLSLWNVWWILHCALVSILRSL